MLVLVLGVVEGDLAAIEAYKSSGGDIARQLTADEVRLLNRPSAFDVGYTLVHLAIRFQRQDMLAILLTEVSMVIWLLNLGVNKCFTTELSPALMFLYEEIGSLVFFIIIVFVVTLWVEYRALYILVFYH
jgi:hypothetical protein